MSTKKKWEDTTSYSRDRRGEPPSTWTLALGPLEIIVTRHVSYPGEWVMHCRALDIDTQRLRHAELAEAQAEAIARVRKLLTLLRGALDAFERAQKEE